MTSRAVVCTEVGDPKTWRIVTKERPKASAGKALIRVTLRPIHPADVLGPELFLAHLGPSSVVTGYEGVGYVEEVGENVTKVVKGQRVVPYFVHQQGNGSWQEYVEVAEDNLFIIPESIPDEAAAQLLLNPWTAYGLIQDQKLSRGDYLVQGAAGSALGRLVIQLAKHWGIKTINIVRRDDVKEELKKLGADEVINSATEDVVARVKEITGGKMAAGALDPLAGKATQMIASCVRDGGKVFIYGFLDSPDHTFTLGAFELIRIAITFYRVTSFIEEKTPKVLADEIIKLLEQGVLQLSAEKIFKLEDVQEALLENAKSGRNGKVLLRS